MKLEIRVWWTGGVVVPEHTGPILNEYRIYDSETGTQVVEAMFHSQDAAQAYLDLHGAEILRGGLPPLDSETEALLVQAIPKFEEQLAVALPDREEAARFASILRRLGRRLSDQDLRRRAEALFERLKDL